MGNKKTTKKILVVDDDPSILDAVSLVLEDEGYDVKAEEKGSKVFDRIATFKPDLLLLDILLSGSDGRIVCKQIKGNMETRSLPIILISAHPHVKDSIGECGADDFLPKPFSLTSLLDIVSRYVG